MAGAIVKVERWLPVVGHDGYEVSDLGRVRSWRRSGRGLGPLTTPRIRKLVPAEKRGGYLTVMFTVDGKYVLRFAHHLVLEAFVGLRGDGEECRHEDGNPKNNMLTNLSWATHTVNIADQDRHGTHTRHERNGGAKLSNEQAQAVRDSDEFGYVLAKRLGVSQATISRVRNGRRYAF